ncbi:hypothetical protein DB88DRAFT_478917 [Papiliotrema laurentii]|uniref:Uncharacterized protein n=1 Tax=Papiliotrema laurentii TaxID=5418 RepID=A0AAD9L937_PAPLA|nr:hypothetical protein DB88DRAFT_478917 [Papiliotrema laurentii]
MRLSTAFLLSLAALCYLTVPATASMFDSSISYCKCICFQNSTIIPLFRPSDPSKPCLSCTRQFCIDQKLPICKDAQVPELDADVGTGTEGDVEARCFKRDSPRDQIIVTFFVLIIIGLLLFQAIRSKLRQAIEQRGRPTDLREWSEALLPDRLQPFSASIFDRVPGSRRERYAGGDMRESSSGRYAPVSVGS